MRSFLAMGVLSACELYSSRIRYGNRRIFCYESCCGPSNFQQEQNSRIFSGLSCMGRVGVRVIGIRYKVVL